MIKVVKQMSLLSLIAFLAACGTIQSSQVALDEHAMIIIKGDKLIGKKLITNKLSILIQKDHLTDYRTGVAGAADREKEKLEVMSFLVDPGMQKVELLDLDKIVFQTSIYMGSGQTRELDIR
ncbi:MAG: hypothetical protein P8O06_07325 [Porticoccaceae bacterium]|nr:hypothetical protein [Porticoccaceae bacterium]